MEAEIKKINPAMEVDRNRIRAALWAMTERDKLKLIRKGTNQQPAEYEKVEEDTKEETPPLLKKASAPVFSGSFNLETAK